MGYERGTNSLPYAPHIVLGLSWLACTVISSILFRSNDQLSHVIGMAASGSFVTIYGGIVKGASTFTQWMGMLLGVWSCAMEMEFEKVEETYRGAILCLIMTAIIPNILPSFFCKLIGQLANLRLLVGVLSLMALVMKASLPHWLPVILSLAYLRNASHYPNGSLYIDKKRYGQHVVSLSLLFCYICNVMNTPPTVIMGASYVTVTLAILFASVGDAWYAVGTGQFTMISLDTAGIVFYFFCPLYVLLNRAMDKYNFSFSMENEYVIMSGFVGIALLQLRSLCPLAGYIHGNVYTHGHPSRKRFAACFHYQKDHFEFYNEKDTPILNVLVSQQDLEDIEKHKAKDQKISGKHELVLSNCPDEEKLKQAVELFTEVTGHAPKWYHASGTEENVKVLHIATMNYNLNIAYWSNTVVSSEKKDGTFYYCKDTDLSLDHFQKHVKSLQNSTSHKMETISTVAIPMTPMVLS